MSDLLWDDYEAKLELLPCQPHPAINEFLHPRFVFASDSELAELAEGTYDAKKYCQMGLRQ